MNKRLVLDTHVFQWFIENDRSRLNDSAFTAIGHPDAILILPALCLLEFYSIIDKDRTPVTRDQLRELFANESRFKICPMTRKIVAAASELTQKMSIHDRAITATAIVMDERPGGAWLVTADIVIRRSKAANVLWAGDAKYDRD